MPHMQRRDSDGRIGSALRRPRALVQRPARAARRHVAALLALALTVGTSGGATATDPQGQLTWGVHTSLAPTWFDPAETSGIVTPYMMMYALHDALLKPMPGEPFAPSLAE